MKVKWGVGDMARAQTTVVVFSLGWRLTIDARGPHTDVKFYNSTYPRDTTLKSIWYCTIHEIIQHDTEQLRSHDLAFGPRVIHSLAYCANDVLNCAPNPPLFLTLHSHA